MTTTTLYTTQVPTLTDISEGVSTNPGSMLGTVIEVDDDGNITAGRWFFPETPRDETIEFVLFDNVTKTQLRRASFVSPTWGARNSVAITPLPVSSGDQFIACVWIPKSSSNATGYTATGGFFNSGPLVNGVLTGSLGLYDYSDHAPENTFNGNTYHVDFVFDDDLVTGPTFALWDGTAEVPVTLTVWDGSAEVAATLDAIV